MAKQPKQIMRRYTVIDRVAKIPPGVILELTPAQAAKRIPFLEDLGKGRFRSTSMLEFMRNEEVGLAELGMGMVHQLAVVEKEIPAVAEGAAESTLL